ncbi:MAG: FliH/SctL family protein [Herbinix sp.]|nr:FliH/SctL family protein [Herbinix sp.]
MSNVIKAYSVRYDDEAMKTINSHLRIDKEIEVRRSILVNEQEAQGEFIEGLNAVVVEAIPSVQETSEKALKIIEDAKNDAKSILDKAKKEAEQIKKEAFEAAKKKGYEEGKQQTKHEAQKLKSEYDEKSGRLEKEYDNMSRSLEPQMAQIIASLLEKLTGIIVADKEEVILYLIKKAIKNMDKSSEYTIRVSDEDYEYVSMRKDILLGAIGRDVPLYITEDDGLYKNQCLIEADLQVINCSLDIQLNNLITDLKLIGGI